MKISEDERRAIREVVEHGERFGYGNLISHLQTAWAKMLMEKYNMDEESARHASGGDGYPFKMQEDLMLRGMWDHTGAAYAKSTSTLPSDSPS